MPADPLAFFTIDHGTATTSVALIARAAGRFRLLAAGAAPSGVDVEALLEDLARRVSAGDPSALATGGWRDWARLESATSPPPSIVCAAGSEGRLAELEEAAAGAGWHVRERLAPRRLDPVAGSAAALDREVKAVALAAADLATGDERGGLPELAALLGAVARRRGDLRCVLAGAARDHHDRFPPEQVVAAPAPAPGAGVADSALRDLLADLAADERERLARPVLPDGRASLRRSIRTLAAILDRPVEGVEVGQSGASRVMATPEGVVGHIVRADAALAPTSIMTDDRLVDGVLRWCSLRGDPSALRDQVRNLRLFPWRDAGLDAARIRLAAARASLARLEAVWRPPGRGNVRHAGPEAEVLIASGGVFSSVPPPAVALALVDTLRRPGALALFHDHARLLAPIGTLREEHDRRRLLADLLDDMLLPLGTALLVPELRHGRHAGTLRVRIDDAPVAREPVATELVPGTVQLFDLPPGVAGTAELQVREGGRLGVRAREQELAVAGGLGGLLVDTREVPLRLPDRTERRRELIEAWERPFWVGAPA